jgi:hypothetical protein
MLLLSRFIGLFFEFSAGSFYFQLGLSTEPAGFEAMDVRNVFFFMMVLAFTFMMMVNFPVLCF